MRGKQVASRSPGNAKLCFKLKVSDKKIENNVNVNNSDSSSIDDSELELLTGCDEENERMIESKTTQQFDSESIKEQKTSKVSNRLSKHRGLPDNATVDGIIDVIPYNSINVDKKVVEECIIIIRKRPMITRMAGVLVSLLKCPECDSVLGRVQGRLNEALV